MGINANGSAVQLYYVEEVNGEVPADPAFKPIRFVSEGLTPNTQQIDSNEINPNRQRPTSRGGTYSVTGEIAAEMSFGSFDDLIEAGSTPLPRTLSSRLMWSHRSVHVQAQTI